MSTHVIDASAVLVWLAGDAGADVVDPLIVGGLLSSVNLGEVLYKVQDFGSDPTDTERDLAELGLEMVDFTPAMAGRFPELKAADKRRLSEQKAAGLPKGKIKRLSLADMACLALALERSATVVTGDRHWGTLGLDLDVLDYHRRP